MNGYDLSRKWFDFAFENQEKVLPKHGILYFWIIELNNRLGWVENFKIPLDTASAAIGVNKLQTTREALNDLVSWGFVKLIVKSPNHHIANVVSIINCNIESGSCLDNSVYLTEKRFSSGLVDGLVKVDKEVDNGLSMVHINKPINNETNKPKGGEVSEPDLEEKKEEPPKVPRKGSAAFDPKNIELPYGENFKSAWMKWVKHRTEIKKPLTETAVSQQLNKLSEYGESMAVNFILQTVEKGWIGIIYELKPGYTPVSVLTSQPTRRATLNDKYS